MTWLCPPVPNLPQELENVQKQAVRMVSGLSSNNYEDKLRELDLWPLVKRRKMYDLVQVYKIINNIGDVNISLTKVGDNNSERINTRLQNDPLNLVKKRSNLEMRKNFFTERVVEHWNNILIQWYTSKPA